MRPHSTLDLETDPFRGPSHPKGERMPQAFAAGFYDGSICTVYWPKKGEGNCIELVVHHVLKWAKGQKEKPIIYMHNGGKFDAHFMLAEILIQLRKMYNIKELKLFCIGSRIVEIETPDCSFRDSYALIPKPLKAFSKKDEIEIEKLEPEVREKHREEITKYLRQDCVGLYDGLSEFFKLYGCGLTLASTAFRILGKDFGGKIRRTSETYDTVFRKAFFAGRVQFFGLGRFGSLDGKKRYEIVDINSSFPWSMTQTHWFSDRYTMVEKAPTEFRDQCFYEITCDSDGVLPVRSSDGVNFPVIKQGKFFVVGHELFKAKLLGLVSSLKIEMVYLPEEVNDFEAYVTHFYELKKNAKTPAEREFAKLFLNASYGKYAQNSRDFVDSIVTEYGQKPDARLQKLKEKHAVHVRKEFQKLNRKKKHKLFEVGNDQGFIFTYEDSEYFVIPDLEPKDSVFQMEFWGHQYDDLQRGLSFWSLPAIRNEGFAEFNNVATAASITALARAKLAEAMAISKGVLYCDTDSIIASDTSKLKKSDKIGDWKLEKECDAIWLGGKKLYVCHGAKDYGVIKKPEGKFFREVHLPQFAFHRYYITKKDFDNSWKMASKGVKLKVEDLIAVCEGEERKYSFDAPNYSVKSKPHFTVRTVRRDDKRKR